MQTNESVKQSITLFKDKNLKKVLDTITDESKSAKQISNDTGISLATVHRKLKILEGLDLLLKSGDIKDGVKEKLFQKKNSFSF